VTAAVVHDFLPSTRGLHFGNRFPPGPTIRIGPFDPRWIGIGDASAGLCGGMSLTVRDLFEWNLVPPPETEPPANGSPRFQSIVRRQVESLDWMRVPLRFYLLSALAGRRETAFDREWPRVRGEIDAGRLVTIGVVRQASVNPLGLTQNHQVLAWAYDDTPDGVKIRIYDPNWPNRDDVTLRVERDSSGRATGMSQSTGEALLAFFVAPYERRPVNAWR
jgi:hypothetical protein